MAQNRPNTETIAALLLPTAPATQAHAAHACGVKLALAPLYLQCVFLNRSSFQRHSPWISLPLIACFSLDSILWECTFAVQTSVISIRRCDCACWYYVRCVFSVLWFVFLMFLLLLAEGGKYISHLLPFLWMPRNVESGSAGTFFPCCTLHASSWSARHQPVTFACHAHTTSFYWPLNLVERGFKVLDKDTYKHNHGIRTCCRPDINLHHPHKHNTSTVSRLCVAPEHGFA